MSRDPRYKLPESVLVVVYTLAGEVLLLRRRQPAWFWQSVTGSLRGGETPRGAAIRELFEETGLRADRALADWHCQVEFPIVPPWRQRYAPGDLFNREHWFGMALHTRRTVRLDSREHRECRWLPVAEAWRRASSWTNRRAIGMLAAHVLVAPRQVQSRSR